MHWKYEDDTTKPKLKEESHMRAPFQVLVLPYKISGAQRLFCIFRRADSGDWQFIAGGGEDNETPIEAARREAFEESGINAVNWKKLKSLSYLPVTVIQEKHRRNWDKDTYVIPEYTFGAEYPENITLSAEHTEYIWTTYEDAVKKLKWDSDRTALYELNCVLAAIK